MTDNTLGTGHGDRHLGSQGASPPGDFNGTGRTDLRDFAALSNCFTGSGNFALTQLCAFFNRDCDGDVDAADYAAFRLAITGP